jgi:hypothetical protein
MLTDGEKLGRTNEVVNSDPDLLQVVSTLRATRRFAGGLNRWQQQGDQDSDNGNHDQQFDERERSWPKNATTHK